MSRRSQRSRASSSSSAKTGIQPSIRRGLESIVNNGNESCVSRMLSVPDGDGLLLVAKLADCMRMNHLSAEMLLARFFDESVLSAYSTGALKKSGKGSTATLAARIAKEWSKPAFFAAMSSKREQEEPSKKKRRIDDDHDVNDVAQGESNNNDDNDDEDDNDDDGDWRKPLFYWKGKLIWNKDKGNFVWRGSWHSAAAENGLPSPSDFEATKESSAFQLTGSSTTVSDPKVHHNTIGALVSAEEWTLRGHYLLDQGDGVPQKHRDKTYKLVFEKKKKFILAGACGTTEFGNFVSAGYVEFPPGDDGEVDFVLARRYIGEKDARNSLVKKKSGGAKSVLEEYTKILSSVDSNDVDPTTTATTGNNQFWIKLLPRTKH